MIPVNITKSYGINTYIPTRPKGTDENNHPVPPLGLDLPKKDHWDPNNGQNTIRQEHRLNLANKITYVDGQVGYSQPNSLYKGKGELGVGDDRFVPDNIDPLTQQKQPNPVIQAPTQQYVERGKVGFEPYKPRQTSPLVPVISPEANYDDSTTTNPSAIHTTWREHKQAMGLGYGLRTNKYLLEMEIPLVDEYDSSKLNILCQSTSFPGKSMTTASMWRFGRKYNLRGETNFDGSWDLTFVDDSEHSIRKQLEKWFLSIDNPKLSDTGLKTTTHNPIQDITQTVLSTNYNEFQFKKDNVLSVKERFEPATDAYTRFDFTDYHEYDLSWPSYQTDIRVYQLDTVGNKVMGYLLQNAFLSAISSVDYDDSARNELVKTKITITYSEFLPLQDNTLAKQIGVKGF